MNSGQQQKVCHQGRGWVIKVGGGSSKQGVGHQGRGWVIKVGGGSSKQGVSHQGMGAGHQGRGRVIDQREDQTGGSLWRGGAHTTGGVYSTQHSLEDTQDSDVVWSGPWMVR